MTRLVAESGGIMCGGLAQVGSLGVTCEMRSSTSWRTLPTSAPRSKTSCMEDRSATDLERISATPSTPVSCSSSGIVMSRSTSDEELPSAMVWISTRGGANSGKTSTGASRTWVSPRTIIPMAARITSHLKRRLEPTVQRIMIG